MSPRCPQRPGSKLIRTSRKRPPPNKSRTVVTSSKQPSPVSDRDRKLNDLMIKTPQNNK